MVLIYLKCYSKLFKLNEYIQILALYSPIGIVTQLLIIKNHF